MLKLCKYIQHSEPTRNIIENCRRRTNAIIPKHNKAAPLFCGTAFSFALLIHLLVLPLRQAAVSAQMADPVPERDVLMDAPFLIIVFDYALPDFILRHLCPAR